MQPQNTMETPPATLPLQRQQWPVLLAVAAVLSLASLTPAPRGACPPPQLHRPGNPLDGSGPSGSLTLSGSRLYGMTHVGGSTGYSDWSDPVSHMSI